jgi:transposase
MERLTMREANKYGVMCEVLKGYVTVREASRILGLSERQLYRLKKRVQERDAEGVIHKSRGKRRVRWLSQGVQDRIIEFYDGKYRGFNISHMTEYLNRDEGIRVSRESVRKILLAHGSYTRVKKRQEHRQWREPSAREGQMIQFDTSVHDWLEGRGPRLYLIGGIDDATSGCVGARFALSDSVVENMRVWKRIIETYGIPLSMYCDGDSKFKTTRHEGVHHQLTDDYEETQIERALRELGVSIIIAGSPEAKGRVERAWGTFQDRLCSELRLHTISTVEEANHYLVEQFIPDYNKRFACVAREEGSAYRKVTRAVDLANIFCTKEQRTVIADNTIVYYSRIINVVWSENYDPCFSNDIYYRKGYVKGGWESEKKVCTTTEEFSATPVWSNG